MSELNTRLIGLRESEDMVAGAFIDTLKNGKVGDNTASIEELEPVEHNVGPIRFDRQVAVPGVHSASDEIIVLGYKLLEAVGLFR